MDNRDNRDSTNDNLRDDASRDGTLKDGELRDSTDSDFVSHENTGGEQALGAGAGAAVGAAWGTLAGPIGTIVGGLAGAVGGWWAARSATEQHLFNLEDDDYYRGRHASLSASNSAGRYSYDDVRPAYQIGHLAGANPDYGNKSFSDVEPHLKGAYATAGQSNWADVRGYASEGYERGRTVAPQRGIGDSSTSAGTLSGSKSTTDREQSLRPEGGIVDRIADTADDLKDRVDGDPSSRPGRDQTDRPTR